MSTAYHPQMDGQSERTIQTLEDMLRVCAIDFKGSWDDHLSLIKFSYNNIFHASIGMPPYEALYGRRCRSPLYWDEVGERKMLGPEVVQKTKDIVDLIRGRLVAAQDRQKKYADLARKDKEYGVGDLVLLKVSPWKGLMRFGKKEKLSPRNIGPFEILRRIGKLAYELALPPNLRQVHNVFHVSMLRKYHRDARHTLLEIVDTTSVQLEFDQFGLHIYNANVKQLVDFPGYEYFSYLGQKTLRDAQMLLEAETEKSAKQSSELNSLNEVLSCLKNELNFEKGFQDELEVAVFEFKSLKEKLECTVLEITSQLDEVQDKLRCFESLDAKMVNLWQLPSNLDIKRSQNNLSVQHKDCQEQSSRPTGLSCQLAEIHEHVLAAEEEKEKLELSLRECVEEKSIITAELALRKEHLENSLTSIDIQDEVVVDTIKSISSNEEIRVKTEMQIYKNQRDAEMEQANAELATKKAVWSQFAKMAQVEADKGRHAQGSVGEGGGKEAVLYDKIRESVARSRVRRQEEITELRKRADEFLCMFNEVQNESKDRLKEIEESQLKLARLQTILESSDIVEYEHVDIQPDLTYVEKPVKIMDKKELVLRNKVIKLVRVLWQNHNMEESTWELESAMLEKYPHLFSI
ncbi:hypothetical protein AgCh_013076 [Apium graveolens]